MVPSAFVPLDALPLTPNGKVDRKALPAPQRCAGDRAGGVRRAMTTTRSGAIAAVWREVLRVERVGVHDNFFDLGGHSLLVVQVHAALQREFAARDPVVDLFQLPDHRALAAPARKSERRQSPARPTRRERVPRDRRVA